VIPDTVQDMEEKLSPEQQERINEARAHNDQEFIEGGAEEKDGHLVLADDQLEKIREDENIHRALSAVDTMASHRLLTETDPDKIQQVFDAEGLSAKSQIEIGDRVAKLYDRARSLSTEVNLLLDSAEPSERLNELKTQVQLAWKRFIDEIAVRNNITFEAGAIARREGMEKLIVVSEETISVL